MKNCLIFIVFIFSVLTVRSQDKPILCFQIDLQDYFVNDTVSLSINQNFVLKDKILTSDRVLGLTNAVLKAFAYKGRGLLLIGGDSIKTKKLSNHFRIKACLNGRKSIYKINLEEGKYIGLDKKNKNNEFIFNQSKNPFEYD